MTAIANNISNIPLHVCVIPDGNRRWATERGLPSTMGHKKGAENFDSLINKARDLGIKCFSAWAFSTENWKRPDDEKEYLFNLNREIIKKYTKKCIDEKIRFVHLGRKDRLPVDIVDGIKNLEEKTKEFTDYTLAIGLDYGGRDELLRAAKKLIESGVEITEESFEACLDTRGMPPADFIIRTSGEQRLSGFMPWQSVYAEYYFPKEYFPDFGPEEFEKAVKEFANRDRRFGGDSKK